MKLAARISRISVSKTMAVMEAAIKLRDQGIDVVDFGPGEPDFPTPENIKTAAIRAIHENFTKYTAIGGIKELKKAIIEKHAREFGSNYDLSECVVNFGGKHALFNIFSAVVEEGDDVIIPTPYWVTFGDIARYVNANPVFVATKESDGFRLTADILERALTPRTRMVVINSPNNPSGAVLENDEFGRIAELCAKKDVLLLSDECYSHFLYDGRKPFSIASRTDLKNHIVIAGSVSKTYAMTGWRIGYVLAPPEIIGAAVKLQSHSTSNPTSISQKAALEALTGPQDSVGVMLAEYARRRKFVLDRLRAIPGVKCAEPGGAFYAYPNIAAAFGRSGIKDSVDFSARLLEKAHVAVTPGEAFGTTDHVRMSYATSMEQLDKGLSRLQEFMGSL
jgi:aspartate aminotransferase